MITNGAAFARLHGHNDLAEIDRDEHSDVTCAITLLVNCKVIAGVPGQTHVDQPITTNDVTIPGDGAFVYCEFSRNAPEESDNPELCTRRMFQSMVDPNGANPKQFFFMHGHVVNEGESIPHQCGVWKVRDNWFAYGGERNSKLHVLGPNIYYFVFGDGRELLRLALGECYDGAYQFQWNEEVFITIPRIQLKSPRDWGESNVEQIKLEVAWPVQKSMNSASNAMHTIKFIDLEETDNRWVNNLADLVPAAP